MSNNTSELIKKIENEKDAIKRIVKLRVIDVTLGNAKEELSFTDIMYPVIEKLLGQNFVDNLDKLNEKEIIKESFIKNVSDENDYNVFEDVMNLGYEASKNLTEIELYELCKNNCNLLKPLFEKKVLKEIKNGRISQADYEKRLDFLTDVLNIPDAIFVPIDEKKVKM
ncbi:MAG: hypothetical protein RSA10_02235 [Bacilli bacterium]